MLAMRCAGLKVPAMTQTHDKPILQEYTLLTIYTLSLASTVCQNVAVSKPTTFPVDQICVCDCTMYLELLTWIADSNGTLRWDVVLIAAADALLVLLINMVAINMVAAMWGLPRGMRTMRP